MLGCMLVTLCMPSHCFVFGVGFSPNTGNEGRFVLQVKKRASILGRQNSWLSMIELLALLAYMCIHFTSSRAIRLLDHHASRCMIGGTRIEDYTPLSLCKDGESGHPHICWKYIAFSLSCLCCRKTRNQRWKLVGRPDFLAGRPPSLVSTTKGGRQVVSHANSWSVAFPRWSFGLLELCASFWDQLQTRVRWGIAMEFTDKATRACIHPSPSETELRQSIVFSFHASLLLT